MTAPEGHRRLLAVDAAINLALGVILLLAPVGSLPLFGVPTPPTFLFTTVLGGVLVGIGIALLVSVRGRHGLGLVGAIVINLCGSLALAGWLLSSNVTLAPLGTATLWAIAIVVLAVAMLEGAARPWRDG
jgi:peptidoglycan/LPS O-acetylase OafA/YrhL